jgi:hypothetical protein
VIHPTSTASRDCSNFDDDKQPSAVAFDYIFYMAATTETLDEVTT